MATVGIKGLTLYTKIMTFTFDL